MLNLIQVEFEKLMKQNIFKLLLLLVVGLSIMTALSVTSENIEIDGLIPGGKSSFDKAFVDFFMVFISAMFAGFFIGTDFSNKTTQMHIATGHSRLEIVLSKSFIFFIGATAIFLLYPITAALVNTYRFGWGEVFTTASFLYILRTCALGTLLNIGTTSFFVFFAFLFKDVPRTICVSVVSVVLFATIGPALGQVIPFIKLLMNYSTLALFNVIVKDTLTAAEIYTILLSATVTALAVMTTTYLLFKKSELK